MSTLSIRKLPKELEKALILESKKQKKTKTDLVISALEKWLGVNSKTTQKTRLRSFFGKMSYPEFKDFIKTTHPFNQIEDELWK